LGDYPILYKITRGVESALANPDKKIIQVNKVSFTPVPSNPKYWFYTRPRNMEQLFKLLRVLGLLFFNDRDSIVNRLRFSDELTIDLPNDKVKLILCFRNHTTHIFSSFTDRIDELTQDDIVEEIHMELIVLNLARVWRPT
jgi:hypothetical protein